MLITDIKRVIEQVSRDKGINTEVLIKTLEEALKSAARKKYGSKIDIEVKYSHDTGEVEVFQFREVVEEVTDPDLEISLKEGLKLDPECEIGDSLGTKLDTSQFGRIAAQSAKQVIIQKIKDAEREAVYASFINRKGEIINGIVQRFDRNNIVVNLGQTEALLPNREQVSGEKYFRGDRVRALIMDVRSEGHGPQIILSRTHPEFLICLFKTEVPEIAEGVVSIMGAAREPGSRGKIAVASNDSDIDPVGACVGMKGSRVQNVVLELRGEKIDIIPWHVDPAKFVCNALSPAEISRVIIDEENRTMEVIVPDESLSVAIGKKGQNVRLASKLTKWRLDVKSESLYSKAMKQGYDSLLSIPGVGISMADALYENGFFSAWEIARSKPDDLMQIRGIDEEEAERLILIAREIPKPSDDDEAEEETGAPDVSEPESDVLPDDTAESDEASAAESDDPSTTAEEAAENGESVETVAAETEADSEEASPDAAAEPADAEPIQAEDENTPAEPTLPPEDENETEKEPEPGA